jgi:predicted nucleotidyltransferase
VSRLTASTREDDLPAGALPFEALVEALRRAASALERAGIDFAVGGSVAAWARGGPEVTHDLDLFVVEADADAAQEALADEGLRIERSPETWLFKAWDGDIPLDVIFRPVGLEVDHDLLAAAERAPIAGMTLPLLALEDVLATKLLAFNDHYLEYVHLLAIARAVREQVDWDAVRRRSEESPYARAFICLLEELEVIDRP